MIILRPLLITALFLLSVISTVVAAESCLDCHQDETPGAVRQWQESAHAVDVGCADCHKGDHEAIVAGEAPVVAAVCGECHRDEYSQHTDSRHGMGLHAGWGCNRNMPDRNKEECRFCHEEGSTLPRTIVHCARFLKQSSEMGMIGCNRCHQVENNCASCHSNHLTRPEIAADPKVCAKCHMGPDHPQWEMWETSMHGTLYSSAGPEVGPSCQLCHMPDGSHDVSRGLTSPPSMKPYPEAEQAGQRDEMIEICSQCHAADFARRDLAAADAVRRQGLALVAEAEEVVRDINDRNLLDPPPSKRPKHPLQGNKLVTDGEMLYEDYSHIERLFFKMKKYSLAKTVKGAYHQNPAYTHWYGNAEMKMDLVDIKAEASRLKKMAAPVKTATTSDDSSFEAKLKLLKKKFDRGALNKEEYEQEKRVLMQGYLE